MPRLTTVSTTAPSAMPASTGTCTVSGATDDAQYHAARDLADQRRLAEAQRNLATDPRRHEQQQQGQKHVHRGPACSAASGVALLGLADPYSVREAPLTIVNVGARGALPPR